jgi:hypothetical protein
MVSVGTIDASRVQVEVSQSEVPGWPLGSCQETLYADPPPVRVPLPSVLSTVRSKVTFNGVSGWKLGPAAAGFIEKLTFTRSVSAPPLMSDGEEYLSSMEPSGSLVDTTDTLEAERAVLALTATPEAGLLNRSKTLTSSVVVAFSGTVVPFPRVFDR